MIYRLFAMCLLGMALLVGCKDDEGPIEKAGEAVEDAADKVGDTAEDAADKVGDAAEDATKD